MSVRGRYVIDSLKRMVSPYVRLPCPPYGQPSYWDRAYKTMGSEDTFEWGSFSFADDLHPTHFYNSRLYHDEVERVQKTYNTVLPTAATKREADSDGVSEEEEEEEEAADTTETTFDEVLGLDKEDSNPKVMLLGCGNSAFGEEFLQASIDQHQQQQQQQQQEAQQGRQVIQVDISHHVCSIMTVRCLAFENAMTIVEDDATQLTAFENESIHATVDKGLLDALFCADQDEQVGQVMTAVHRTLVPGGVFCIFSFSRPQFLLPHLCQWKKDDDPTSRGRRPEKPQLWQDVQVRALDSVLLYRFVKNARSLYQGRGGGVGAGRQSRKRIARLSRQRKMGKGGPNVGPRR